MDPDIRARARVAMRAQLAEAIVDVFVEKGYEQVTTDEAAAAVGISRATFFRYFAGKEDVVVAAVETETPDYGAVLAELEPRPGRTIWELARAALEPTIQAAVADKQRRRERLRLIGSHPALRARFSVRREQLVAALAAALEARVGDPAAFGGMGSLAVAASAMAMVDVAWRRWASSDDVDLVVAVDEGFAALGASGAPLPRG